MQIKKIFSLHRNQLLYVLVPALFFLAACTEPLPANPTPDLELSELLAETAVPETVTIEPLSSVTPAQAAATEPPTATLVPVTDTPSPTATPYIVQAGDTLEGIAARFGVSQSAIVQANNIVDPNLIRGGQALFIPSGEGAAQPIVPAETIAATEIPATPESAEPSPDVPATAAPFETSTRAPGNPTSGGELKNVDGAVRCPVEFIPLPDDADDEVGRSAVCNLPIASYKIGSGETPLILIGGIHGGYEWNTILLAYEMLKYLETPGTVPESLTVYLIPNANPDGLYAVSGQTGTFYPGDMAENTVPGRFNGNNVDLNRNWNCNWTKDAFWRTNPIDGGDGPLSEPENQALHDYILNIRPPVVLFWHSAATGVYAAGCGNTDPASKKLARVYGEASGYPVYDSFQYYDITGDAGDYLATYEKIPSISVELTDHENLNLTMNQNGLKALLEFIAANPDPIDW